MAFDPEFPNDKAVREAVALAAEARTLRMAQSKAAPLDRAVSSGPPRRDGVRNDAAFEALKRAAPLDRAVSSGPPRRDGVRNDAAFEALKRAAPLDRAVSSDVPRPEDAPRPGAPTVKRPQFNMPSPEKAIADLVRDIDTTARVAAGTASSMASFPLRTMDTAYNNIRGEFDGRPRREYEGPLHNAMLTFARETPPVSSPQAAAPGAVSAGRGRPKIARAGMDATPLGGAVAARNYDGSVMTSGEGTPVYKGRAKFGGVDQPVFTDSPYDPLLVGKAGKEGAAFLQANPKLRDAHIKAMQPVQDRLKRRTDAVAAAGPQYSLAELGTVANVQKTLAEAGKINAEASIAANADSRVDTGEIRKGAEYSDSIVDRGIAAGASPTQALLMALENSQFSPELSVAYSSGRVMAREDIAELFKDYQDPTGTPFDPSQISLRTPTILDDGLWDGLMNDYVAEYTGPRANPAVAPEVMLDEKGAKRLRELLKVLSPQKKATQ